MIQDDVSAITRARLPDWLLRLLAAAVFAAVYSFVLLPVARFYWFVPAGWRFAALALAPWRYWPWILGGELASRVWYEYVYDPPFAWQAPLPEFFFTLSGLVFLFAGPLGGMLGSLYFRQRVRDIGAALEGVSGMSWLIVSCLIGALGETAGNLLSIHLNHDVLQLSYSRFVVGKFVGDYIGVIGLAPALFALVFARKPRTWRLDALVVAAILAAYAALIRADLDEAVYGYLRLFVLIPTYWCAMRGGWRGAAVVLALSGFVVALAPSVHPLAPYHDLFTQLLLAMFGSAALLLGSAMDAQRASSGELIRRNVHLEVANRDLERVGRELREVAERNLTIEEEQRRRLARAIHDELGQNITAMHTRLKMAQTRINETQMEDVASSLYDILGQMRRAVHALMDSLRPPVLDEFGLLRALDDGPLRDMVELAGMSYVFRLGGEPALIDALAENTQIALWRIAQETSTNTVRHANAKVFEMRLRVGIRGGRVWALLDLRDDGVGIGAGESQRQRGGLQSIRDRVLALDGAMKVQRRGNITRLHLLLRQAL
ncbi:MAG TPA: MASE1 domain-containing protein [Rudaea sp.]|jgi:glucose-6-phosphate-specific signal transduction histidine kinase|nr:MASE1 domain-containing protein [Rudaea sp.]